MRLFVAVYPSAEALDDISSFVDRLTIGRAAAAGINARRTAPHLQHVTLAFLGEVPEDRLGTVETAVEHATAALRPVQLRLAGGGSFGRGTFTVVWVGVHGPVHGWATAVRGMLMRYRLPVDRKLFRPHLTLARPGDRLGSLEADLEALQTYRGPAWQASRVHVVCSRVGPAPVHETIAVWPVT